MGKRIACFIGLIIQDFQSRIADTLTSEANKIGYTLDIFSEFGTYKDNYLHAEGEKSIIHIPSFQDYDGILMCPDTFDNGGMYEELVEKIHKEATCPCVTIRSEDGQFYNVLSDDKSATVKIIDHLIEHHGYKRICYMTGRMNMQDAQDRFEGYQLSMHNHGLPITEHMVFYGDYWKDKAEAAIDWFLENEERPEVMACANDYMALEIIKGLLRRKIKVPDEMAVVGFDHIEEAEYATPKLAGVSVAPQDFALEAIHMLHDLIEGKTIDRIRYVQPKTFFEGSCGCGQKQDANSVESLYLRNDYLKNALMQTSYMNADFENCNTVEELINFAYLYSLYFPYTQIFFCFNECSITNIANTKRYTENMKLVAVMDRNLGVSYTDVVFNRRELLPADYRENPETTYFYPLHYKNHSIGYLALRTDGVRRLGDFFRCWILSVSGYLDKASVYEENKNLQEYRRLSTIDDLTGLYNRRKLESELMRLLTSKKGDNDFFLVSLDMDGLKTINDTFGHYEGDVALKTFAEVLKAVSGKSVLSARVGGDEFILCITTADEDIVENTLNTIRAHIKSYNEKNDKPYLLDCSMGYAKHLAGEDLYSCLQRADKNMYADKMKKKNHRR